MNWGAIAQGAAQVAGQVAPAILNYRSQKKDREAQYDAAQNSISWRVQDARNAGIHPLFALGAQPYNMSPVSVGFQPMDFSSAFNVVSQKTQQKQQERMNELQIQNMELKNKALQNEITASKFGQDMATRGVSQIPVFNQSVPTSGQLDGSDIASNIPGFAKKVGSFYQLEGVAGKRRRFTAGVQQDKADLVSEDIATKLKHYKLMHNPFEEARQRVIASQLTDEAHARGEISRDEILIPIWEGFIDGWEYEPVYNSFGRENVRPSYLGAKYRHGGVYYGE